MNLPTHILITGGAGFIGSSACRYFLDRDVKVTCVDALTYAATATTIESISAVDGFTFVHADITDEMAIWHTLNGSGIDAILNFAAESHVDRSITGPDAFLKTNVMGTYNMLQQARRYRDGLKSELLDRFVFLHVSTDEVFGDLKSGASPFAESTPYSPSSPYSASKASSDHLVSAWGRTYGLPTLITNCSNNYGPYQFPEKLLPVVITRCLDGLEIPVYGNGRQIRDWLYVEDHVDAIATVLAKGTIGETYNIGTRNERTNLELVGKICSILDELSPCSRGTMHFDAVRYVADRPGHDLRYAVDPSKIERELGWRSSHSFNDAMYATVQWYLENQNWWRPLL
jgi:dTDP-glucose 4,6-dehydratase